MFNINNNSSYANKTVLVVWDEPTIYVPTFRTKEEADLEARLFPREYSWHALEKVTEGLNKLFAPIQFKKIDNFSDLAYDDPEKYANFILYLVTPLGPVHGEMDKKRFNMIKSEFSLFKRNLNVQPIIISLVKAITPEYTHSNMYGKLVLTYTGMRGLDEKSHVNNTTRDLLFTILVKDDPSLLPHSYSYTIPIEKRKNSDDYLYSSYHYQDNIVDNDDVSF